METTSHESTAAADLNLSAYLQRWRAAPTVVDIARRFSAGDAGPAHLTITGTSGSSVAWLAASVQNTTDQPVLIVAPTADSAVDCYDDLSTLIGDAHVGHFPARQILPFDFKAPVGEIMGRRISTVARLSSGSLKAVVAPIRALLEPTIHPDHLAANRVDLREKTEIDLDNLIDRLVRLGFRRSAVVEEVGDFAVRGGVIDFFSPGADDPIRVELFGDEIDTIRQFDVATQRTIRRLPEVLILPRREVAVNQQTLESQLDRLPAADADFIRSRFLNDPELPGLEWLATLFNEPAGGLLDYLPDSSGVFLLNRERLEEEEVRVRRDGEEQRQRMADRFSSLPECEAYYHASDALWQQLTDRPTIDIVPFSRPKTITLNVQPHPSFGSRLDLLSDSLRDFRARGIEPIITVDNPGQVERLSELLTEKLTETLPEIVVANLSGGFVAPDAGIAVLTDHEIFHRYHRRVRRKKFKEGVAISDYAQLVPNDLVVHTDHGIARYVGLQTLTVDNRTRDCLLLHYQEGDKLFVPIEEFNRVGKYAGGDAAPELTRLGGASWERLKKKTEQAIADMADDLLRIYAQRAQRGGFDFGPDTTFLRQLEASFPFEETPDQAKAIADVKRDMASERAMDRLVCGDVGYGKTEVAIRAAFKAIDAGKQVALLVPTTLLAQQHLTTFRDRLAEFPVRIEMLSRYRNKKEQQATLDALAAGTCDLVIGTHRLLSGDVAFKDLGLLVIDEEHRFGVRHKERLRELKATVDTIAMTATPIPRTMQMALTGVRDMSVIATSPRDRLPISTEISEVDDAVVAAAIQRELARGGQVFFVHNRVQTIDSMYDYLVKLLPDARIGVAHGQMHERSLETIMLNFLNRSFDVLLCTTIIESGLDIPNANTIIINRANTFGLAQLYQLRGRVGRSSRRAYAYLLTPPARQLTPEAVRRLRAIEAHADLGSGFALAMRDLEIRGAGSLLGAKQSGFIEQIGYDLYTQLLEETIARLKGEEVQRAPATKLDLTVDLFLPEAYVPDTEQKVDLYRRLADARDIGTVSTVAEELADRFGRLPQPAIDLVAASAAKVAAAHLGIEHIRERSGRVTLHWANGCALERSTVEAMRTATDCPMEFQLTGKTVVTIDLARLSRDDRMTHLRDLLAAAV